MLIEKKSPDLWLFITVIILMAIGAYVWFLVRVTLWPINGMEIVIIF